MTQFLYRVLLWESAANHWNVFKMEAGWEVAHIIIHWLTASLSLLCVQVDLFQLQVNTLRRYKRHYKLQTRPGLNKAQLAEVTTEPVRTRCPLRDGCLVLCTIHVALSFHFVQHWNSGTQPYVKITFFWHTAWSSESTCCSGRALWWPTDSQGWVY